MRSADRQSQISTFLAERGYASLNDLVARFGVSVSTIRRDLDEMQRRGIVRRTHGGAFHIEAREHPLDYHLREERFTVEKETIGECAASLVQDGEAILLDGGTTTFQVGRFLRGRSLQVVTNSLPVAKLLGTTLDTEVIFLGGTIMPRTGVTVGRYAEEMLRSLRVSKAIMGVAGITQEGLFNANLLMVELERLAIEVAEEVIVVVDHSKFGRRSLVHLCDFSAIHHLVTDSLVARSWVELLKSRGVNTHIMDIPDQADGPDTPGAKSREVVS